MRRRLFAIVLGLCCAATVLPLWLVSHLPAVDAPQHLFLVHVLGHADEAPYRDLFVARPGLTYLVFYYAVRLLAPLVGVETGLKIWLTLVLAGIPLSLLALLRALGRSRWLALLACPLVLTDNFYWGLFSFLSALPLTLLVLALFVRALETPVSERRHGWALAGLAASLVAVQLTHAAAMILPALALPLLLATTPSDRTRRLRALAALVPGVALFLAWLLSGVGQGRKLGAPGEPWKASGPLLDARNFQFDPLAAKAAQLPELLYNGFWSWADRPILYALAAAVLVAVAGALLKRESAASTGTEGLARWRPALLAALALGLYFGLPRDIAGYMYSIYPRYAQVAALLLVPLVPLPRGRVRAAFAVAAAAAVLFASATHTVLFRRFDAEARAFERVAEKLPANARVMHLVTHWGSRHASHAVYLHYAALAALRANGVPSFSLATDPSFPVQYRGEPPPASPWEWRPTEYPPAALRWYDAYLARGDVPPERLFGVHAGEVELTAAQGLWRLYRRRE